MPRAHCPGSPSHLFSGLLPNSGTQIMDHLNPRVADGTSHKDQRVVYRDGLDYEIHYSQGEAPTEFFTVKLLFT